MSLLSRRKDSSTHAEQAADQARGRDVNSRDAEGHELEDTAQLAVVARQPIFDPQLSVVGYELLYRSVGAEAATFECPLAATIDVIVTSALDIGLKQLADSAPVFINFPRELLTEELPTPANPNRIVVEVLEDIEPDETLIKVLDSLRGRGYRIALDDFDPLSNREPLLDHTDFVKVDVLACDAQDLPGFVAYLRRWKIGLIAEKVETEEQFNLCRELGFDAFQGYFLRRPEMFYAKRAPGNWIATLRLLFRLQDPDVSIEDLESTIACDVGLCCRLLRCVNSSYFGFGKAIESIARAIVVMGLEELRAICTALLLAGIGDRPKYLGKQAMIRARMCERLCVAAGLRESQSYFMAGLLSFSDVLLGMPLDEVLDALPLTDEIRGALLHRAGEIGEALLCVNHYETAVWERVRFRELPISAISRAYADGVQWTEKLWTRVSMSAA